MDGMKWVGMGWEDDPTMTMYLTVYGQANEIRNIISSCWNSLYSYLFVYDGNRTLLYSMPFTNLV